jgi:iron-sulfur cluster repair protein YtfE (RIC family)
MPIIYDLLQQDHRKVASFLTQIQDSSEGAQARNELFSQVKRELEIHTDFEEQVVYPALREATGKRDEIEEAYSEHTQVKQLLAELAEMEQSMPEWLDTCSELASAIQHHVKEEEQELFPAGRKSIDQATAEDMGREYQGIKERAAARA